MKMKMKMNIQRMPEPTRTLLLQAFKTLGKAPRNELLGYMEEELTLEQRDNTEKFLDWLYKWGLTVGHGTIDLRHHEFTHKVRPMTSFAAYEWAMKQAGL